MNLQQSSLLKAAVVDLSFNLLEEYYPDGSVGHNELVAVIEAMILKESLTEEALDEALVDDVLFLLLIPYLSVDNYLGEGRFESVYDILKSYAYALSSDEIKKILRDLLLVIGKSTEYMPLSLPLFVAKTFGSSEIKISEVYIAQFKNALFEIALTLNEEQPQERRLSDEEIASIFKINAKKSEPAETKTAFLPSKATIEKETKSYVERLTSDEFATAESVSEEDNEELYFKLYIPPEDTTAVFEASVNKKIGVGVFAVCMVTAALVWFWTRLPPEVESDPQPPKY